MSLPLLFLILMLLFRQRVTLQQRFQLGHHVWLSLPRLLLPRSPWAQTYVTRPHPHPAAEGLLISPHMYRDHLCSTAYEALTKAAEAASQQEASSGAAEGGGAAPGGARLRGRQDERRRQRAARHRWQQRLAAQRSSSLQEVLVEAV